MHKEEIFGRILQEEREAKKISQEKLAKLTGLDRTFISLIENGKRSPTLSTILKICSALEINPSADKIITKERSLLCPLISYQINKVSTVSNPCSGMRSDHIHNGWAQHRVQRQCVATWQTVMHCHCTVIPPVMPRCTGYTRGIRGILPGKRDIELITKLK